MSDLLVMNKINRNLLVFIFYSIVTNMHIFLMGANMQVVMCFCFFGNAKCPGSVCVHFGLIPTVPPISFRTLTRESEVTPRIAGKKNPPSNIQC